MHMFIYWFCQQPLHTSSLTHVHSLTFAVNVYVYSCAHDEKAKLTKETLETIAQKPYEERQNAWQKRLR